MSINQQIKTLLTENTVFMRSDEFKNILDSNGNPINENIVVYDGLVNESKFGGILFLLKEAVQSSIEYDHKDKIINDTFDLISTAQTEALNQSQETYSGDLHWKELCEWIEVYKKPKTSFKHLKDHGGNLAEIALVNIKKIAGLSKTNPKVIYSIVNNETYANILKKEIELINPQIVICCGTFDYAKILYPTPVITDTLECGVEYFISNNITFVDFIHPTQYGAAAKQTMKFAYAKAVFGELKTAPPKTRK